MAQTAKVICEGVETVVRIVGSVRLPPGPVAVREIENTGELLLTPIQEASDQNPWIEFFDAMDRVPRDEYTEAFFQVMRERPLNQFPAERNLFADAE